MATYEIVDCATLLSRKEPAFEVETEQWSSASETAIPPISYGACVRPPDFVGLEWPPDNWNLDYYGHPGLTCYRLHNARLHGELGIITVGPYCIRESLQMVFPKFHGFAQDDSHITLPDPKRTSRVNSAAHALCGYVGNRNYAHWWIDIVPVLAQYCFEKRSIPDLIALPGIRAAYQTQTLDLFAGIASKYHFMGECDALDCDSLDFVPLITAGDYMPDRSYMRMIEEMKRMVGPAATQGTSRIFISRKDTGTRTLENEDELSRIAERFGYQTVTTSGLSIKEQIRMFGRASHLIGAHGAGLANMLFCPPHARLLELHSNASVNWSLRRLASIVPLTYGCLLGETITGTEEDKAPADRPWRLDPSVFEATIAKMSA